MNRKQLEHIIRAACTVADDDELIVIGSQSVLGQYPSPPEELTHSLEADVYPKNHPERADLIDGALGELSMFHQTFGYYADGVGDRTATLPQGWSDRLIAVRNANTLGKTGWCLELHDLLIAKYVAGRDKDRRFTAAAARHGLARSDLLVERLAQTDIPDNVRAFVRHAIDRDFADAV